MINKKNNGITLISLVVMIVILLMLAGVTISTLTGDNGIIVKSVEAKEDSEKMKADEDIELAIRDSIGVNGFLKDEDIYKNLNKIENISGVPTSVEEIAYPLKVVVNAKYEYVINEDGSIGEKQETEDPPPVITTEIEIGDYVQYDVGYTDMNTSYNFTAVDGWRVLDKGTNNGDGTFSGIKLISTGIPAELNYSYRTIKSIELDSKGTLGRWAGNKEQRLEYTNKIGLQGSQSYTSIYATAGMWYNFNKIKFNGIKDKEQSVAENEAAYISINGKKDEVLSGEIFLTDKAKEAHALTLEELNIARGLEEDSTEAVIEQDVKVGLFYIKNLKQFDYSDDTSVYYWLATPKGKHTDDLKRINNSGGLGNKNEYQCGIRVVVSLKDNSTITKVEEKQI